MTVPVIQEQTDEKRTMAFVVPKEYEENVPFPMDDGVAIERMTWSYVAVIRFWGLASERKIRIKGRELHEWIRKKGWVESDMEVVAFCDPPFQVPFLRRSEMMIGINWKEEVDGGER